MKKEKKSPQFGDFFIYPGILFNRLEKTKSFFGQAQTN